METFSIASPPNAPGIYLLRNTVAKTYYIGKTVNLRRRWIEWRGAFANQSNLRNSWFIDAINSTMASDWDFAVVQELDGIPAAEWRVYEQRAIKLMRAVPGITLLNDFEPEGTRVRSTALSSIRDGEQQLTITEAARRIGCQPDTLTKRLQKWRKRGRFEWTLDELQNKPTA
jgi:hypothetical protein